MMKKLAFASIALLAMTGCQDQAGSGQGGSRNQIQIVGSSTVYPFAKAVAEQFAQQLEDRPSAILESTGTGGGIEIFCQGMGANTPDMANASRRMKRSELERCIENGVEEVVEFAIGLDGIAIAQSVQGPELNLTTEDLYKALAANPYGEPNPYTNWSDIDPVYPDVKINVYGPPSTSGTRDAFEELVMMSGCTQNPTMTAMMESNEDEAEKICTEIRGDGPYVEAGENDNLIVQKLGANPQSVGIFGYSFLEENQRTVRGIPLDGVAPNYDQIASGRYPGARTMYVYLKKAHVGVIPGLKEYIAEFLKGAEPGSYLSEIGLIPTSNQVRQGNVEALETMPALGPSQLL